ncbi:MULTISPECIES: ATP-binding domain-containing protein [Sorangium]|uniref:DNA helicase n=1 Tax=Sorangium cellulosum TaxID=56 RepID=A0A4P2QG01_SORCE|nr:MULTISPECIES: ATP-binding domain-containing protein [Sorangium]AUX28765.1 DNA helicase [Sorangium cellulosum]WCQ88162.1 DNA helicase [Sorangium sp. Soce836]
MSGALALLFSLSPDPHRTGIPVTANRSTSPTPTEEPSTAPSSATVVTTSAQPAAGAPGAGLSANGEAIVREEEAVLARVTAHLATATTKPSRPPPIENYEEQLLSLRDQIAAARLEDVPALVQQMERLQGIAARRNENVVEPVDPKSPYFGHLRLREKGRPERDVLIGRTTLVDASAGVRIVDWRHAPVSQIYYRYEEGAEYEETFGEREVEGTVLVRRTVTIDDGELYRIAAPQGTFVRGPSGFREIATRATELAGGQGSAVRPEDMRDIALAAGARGGLGTGAAFHAREDRHLPEIAALLDPRQFELISKPDAGIVVIQGGAGSGKTTIGVHRLAFLAYNGGRRFTADKMLVIVGSPALRAYISEALPALGLGGIAVETFSEWARVARKRAFPWLEAPVEENTPSVVTRYKTHPAMLHLLEQRASELKDDARARRDSRGTLAFWADLLTDLDRVLAAFEAAGDPEFGPEQVKRAWRWCADRCPAVLDLDPGDRAERKAAMADEPAGDDERGADAREVSSDDRAVLDPEDDALLLRAYQLLRGELRKGKNVLTYEHLFVDEAQDLAPIDLAVLLGVVAEPRSVTLAGDTAQRLFMDSGFRDWRATLDDLGLSRVDVEPLRIAYRSTREVLAFARAVLGPLADPTPPLAPRSGAPVEHHHFPSAGAAVAFLADAIRPLFAREPRATLAILARHPEQADVYYDALRMAEIPNLRRVRAYEFAFRPGVEVTEIRQVKGLEYDYVVLVDANASTYPADDESRHLLHIGATRAAHQLWVVSTAAPSPLLPDWLG